MKVYIKNEIKKRLRERGFSSLRSFCKAEGLDYKTLCDVLNFHKTSRTLIFKLAKILSAPELLFLYEEALQKKKLEKSNKRR